MVYLKFLAAMLAMLLVPPVVTALATGSWRRTVEAMKGYLVVIGLVIALPMAVGTLLALVGLID